jgi:hypothetical protein
VLHEPAEEVKREDIGSARIEKTINDMVDVMRAGPGVGLAAPQIGVPLQVCNVRSHNPWYPGLNPFCPRLLHILRHTFLHILIPVAECVGGLVCRLLCWRTPRSL